MRDAEALKSQIRYSGFLAQEVEAAAKSAGYDFSGVDGPKNNNDIYGLRYAEFVVPLVKAVQEQQQMLEAQQKTIELLQKQIKLLEEKLAKP
jgi:trimeric autotransporter adhesin